MDKLRNIVVREIGHTKKDKYHKTRNQKGAQDREGRQNITSFLSRVTRCKYKYVYAYIHISVRNLNVFTCVYNQKAEGKYLQEEADKQEGNGGTGDKYGQNIQERSTMKPTILYDH